MTSNFERFQEIKKLADYKGYSSHVIWNPEICQDPPTCGQDDLVLMIGFYPLTFSEKKIFLILALL